MSTMNDHDNDHGNVHYDHDNYTTIQCIRIYNDDNAHDS